MKEVNEDSHFKVDFSNICKKQFEFKFAKEDGESCNNFHINSSVYGVIF